MHLLYGKIYFVLFSLCNCLTILCNYISETLVKQITEMCSLKLFLRARKQLEVTSRFVISCLKNSFMWSLRFQTIEESLLAQQRYVVADWCIIRDFRVPFTRWKFNFDRYECVYKIKKFTKLRMWASSETNMSEWYMRWVVGWVMWWNVVTMSGVGGRDIQSIQLRFGE